MTCFATVITRAPRKWASLLIIGLVLLISAHAFDLWKAGAERAVAAIELRTQEDPGEREIGLPHLESPVSFHQEPAPFPRDSPSRHATITAAGPAEPPPRVWLLHSLLLNATLQPRWK